MERYGSTTASATAHLEDALHEGLTDTSAEIHAGSTVAQLSAAWWPEFLDSEPATSTRLGYRRSLDEIEANVGQLRIREATVPWLDRYLKTLADERGPSVAKRHKVLFSHMLGYAVRHGAASANAAESTKPPTGKRSPVTAPDAAAIDAMRERFRAYDERPRTLPFLRDFADLLIATGARTSEVLALRWQDVDLEHGKLTITGTLVSGDDGRVVRQAHPKTEHGRRRLTLPDDAVGLLLARRMIADSDWVLCARRRHPLAEQRAPLLARGAARERARRRHAARLPQSGRDHARSGTRLAGGRREARARLAADDGGSLHRAPARGPRPPRGARAPPPKWRVNGEWRPLDMRRARQHAGPSRCTPPGTRTRNQLISDASTPSINRCGPRRLFGDEAPFATRLVPPSHPVSGRVPGRRLRRTSPADRASICRPQESRIET
ncbi:tyrosine-type recombinase/integrase [Agrococcus sp. Marseille-Q4369]|uniref:site-specific integrase n=1 Tax=Agrococcus sp. Marseille-Q4369 TaxID=2810513 RepID=UPI001B8CF9A9|nr:tyrosine-type recombinase/integrase [Agrococcus sp. Marseille-Q4369]QUW18653.1 tyrosine-type recombinase/integrase [Agrococcus sp. Marseille-Q4369]